MKVESYFYNLVASFDQALNALAAGNRDTTISGRCYITRSKTGLKVWSTLEKIVNWAFYPIDGPDHCKQAYKADAGEVYRHSRLINVFAVPFGFGAVVLGLLFRVTKLF